MIELKITANSVEELRDIAAKVSMLNGRSTAVVEATIENIVSTPVQTEELKSAAESVTNVGVAATPESESLPVVETTIPAPPAGQSEANPTLNAIAPAPAEYDDRGVAWSPDFHASTKAKTQEGAWKKKRGGDHEALAAYEAQFTSVAVAPNAVPVPSPHANMTMPGQGGVMPQPDVTPEVVSPAPAAPMDAKRVMEIASALVTSGARTPAYLQELAEHAGLGSIGEMFANDTSVGVIAAKLQADGHA